MDAAIYLNMKAAQAILIKEKDMFETLIGLAADKLPVPFVGEKVGGLIKKGAKMMVGNLVGGAYDDQSTGAYEVRRREEGRRRLTGVVADCFAEIERFARNCLKYAF